MNSCRASRALIGLIGERIVRVATLKNSCSTWVLITVAPSAAVRPGGLLLLSTLSPRDPQHYAVGQPVLGEERSWVDRVYLHFCTADELVGDFSAFAVLDLEERSYDEHNARGVEHRHASWFLEGRRR